MAIRIVAAVLTAIARLCTRRLVDAAIGILIGCAWWGVAKASSVVDQSYFPLLTLQAQARSIDYSGQTFTVGISGELTGASMTINACGDVHDNLDLYLIRVANSTFIGAPLATVVVPYTSLPACYGVTYPSDYLNRLLTIDLRPYHIEVSAGETFALMMHSAISFADSSVQQINWLGGCENNATAQCGGPGTSVGYTRGQAIQAQTLAGPFGVNPTFTFGFETFVDPTALPFAGTPGKPNCHGQSVSTLAKQYGGLNNAAADLGYSSVSALQAAIMKFCEG